MDYSELHHRRHSEDLRKSSQDHFHPDRHYTYGQNSGGIPAKKNGEDAGSYHIQQPKQRKQGTRNEGIVKKYGTVLLAAGLGFGAGLLFAGHTGKGRAKNQGRSHSRSKRDYPASYEGRGRLAHRYSDDHLALTRPGARAPSFSHSTQYPRDDDTRDGYWR